MLIFHINRSTVFWTWFRRLWGSRKVILRAHISRMGPFVAGRLGQTSHFIRNALGCARAHTPVFALFSCTNSLRKLGQIHHTHALRARTTCVWQACVRARANDLRARAQEGITARGRAGGGSRQAFGTRLNSIAEVVVRARVC